MPRILLALLLMIVPLAAAAQAPSERMAPLAGLVGEWQGTGWMLMPDGNRAETESRETVTVRLSGAALLIEGRHWRPGEPDRLVHDAMAMIVWDSRTNAYRMRSTLASGLNGDFPLEVGEGSLIWRMETPQGTIEYTTRFGDGTWRESGRLTMADGRQVEIFGMELTRR